MSQLAHYGERFFFALTAGVVGVGVLMMSLEGVGWLTGRCHGGRRSGGRGSDGDDPDEGDDHGPGGGNPKNDPGGDEMEKAGLQLPPLSSEVQAELRQILPLAGSIFVNPVDATNLLSPRAISATMRVLRSVPEMHMLVYHLGFHPVSRWGGGLLSLAFVQAIIEALADVRQVTGKPVLLALRPAPDWGGMKDFLAAQEAFVKAGFPVFHSLHRLGAAMARVVAWKRA